MVSGTVCFCETGGETARERCCINGEPCGGLTGSEAPPWHVLGDVYNMRPQLPLPPSTCRYQMAVGGEGAESKKLTAVWIIRVIIGDVDGASVELAFGRYIRNGTRDL